MAYLLSDIQYVSKYHLSYGGSAICRNVGDNDTSFTGGSYVYYVVACSQHADIFQIGQGSHHFAVDHYFIGEEGFCTGSTFQYFSGGGTVINYAFAQLFQLIPAKITGICGVTV